MRWLPVIGLVAASSVANASPAAEKLFEDGRHLLGEGKLPEACDAFRRSEAIEPKVGTLLNLGDCEEKRGRLATAWAAFAEARGLAKRQNDPRAEEADHRAAALSDRLPQLTIVLASDHPEPGLVVKRDGADVPSAALGFEAPADPGATTVVASAAGFKPWSKTVTLAEGAHERIEIPGLTAVPGAAPLGAAPPRPSLATPAAEWPHRHLAVGAIGGAYNVSGRRARGGARVIVKLGELGKGLVRVVPSYVYSQPTSAAGPSIMPVDRHEIGLAIEYVGRLSPHFTLAGGLGGGADWVQDNPVYDGFVNVLQWQRKPTWLAFRVGPAVELGRFDLAIGLQLYTARYDGVSSTADISLDCYFW